jgi:O-antigen ligase
LIVLAVGLSIALLPLTLAGGAVLGGIVFLATLIRPEVGLYLLIIAVPFGSVREIAISGFTVGAAEALVGLVLAAWLAKHVLSRSEVMIAARQVKIAYPPLVLPLLIFLGAILLSLTGALSLRYSFKEILKWLEVLGIYLFVANAIEREQAKAVVLLILLAGIGQALLGFYQFFGRVGPQAFVILGGFVRAYGTFEQPNPYGGYLGLVLPLACGILLGIGKPGYWRYWILDIDRLVAIIGLAVMGAALIMSWSRGAWLGFAAAFVLMNLAYSRRVAVLFALLCLLVSSVLVLGSIQALPQTIVQRFTDFLPFLHGLDVGAVKVSPANYAVLERMAHWQAAWGMFNDRPWLGVGIGNYEPVYPAYALQGWPLALGHAHNYYLNIAAEAGLIGLAAYLVLWGAAFWQAFRVIRATQGYWRGVAVGILGVLTHLAVHNFFDNLYVHNMYLHVAMLLGLLFVIVKSDPTRPTRPLPRAISHVEAHLPRTYAPPRGLMVQWSVLLQYQRAGTSQRKARARHGPGSGTGHWRLWLVVTTLRHDSGHASVVGGGAKATEVAATKPQLMSGAKCFRACPRVASRVWRHCPREPPRGQSTDPCSLLRARRPAVPQGSLESRYPVGIRSQGVRRWCPIAREC